MRREFLSLVEHRPTAVAIWLALFFSLFYLASARGTLSFGDDASMLAVTRAIATKGSVAVPPATPGVSPGRDGQYYSKYGLGQSLLALPFYFVGAYVQNQARPDTYPNPYANPITYWICLLGICSGVGAVVFLYLSCIGIGFGERASIIAAMAFGAGTFEWFYARTFMTEVPSTCLLTAAFYGLLRSRDAMPPKWLLLSGFGLGLAVLVRLQNAVLLPAFGIWLICELWIWHRYDLKKRLASMVVWSAPILASLIVIAAYNYLRFGSVTDVGIERPVGPSMFQGPFYFGFYEYLPQTTTAVGHQRYVAWGIFRGIFQTPFYVGLYGFLLSSGKGIFWYAPILLPAVYGWRFLWKKHQGITGVLGVLVGSNLLFYCPSTWWFGGGVWGPRLMVQILPFLMIGLAALIDHGLGIRGWVAVGATAALSLFIQVTSVLVSYVPYEGWMERTRDTFDELLWNPACSPIIVQAGHLLRHQYPFDLAYNAYPAPEMARFQLVAFLASMVVLAIGVRLFFDARQLGQN